MPKTRLGLGGCCFGDACCAGVAAAGLWPEVVDEGCWGKAGEADKTSVRQSATVLVIDSKASLWGVDGAAPGKQSFLPASF